MIQTVIDAAVLSLAGTRVSNLSTLAGMPLKYFNASTIPAADYSPLAGLPLEKCTIQNSPLSDLSFLWDSPVKELCLFGCNELRGYSVLASLKSLDLLILPQSFRSLPEEELAAIGALRAHPTLRNIQTEYRSGGGWIINTTQSKDVFWKDWDIEQTFVPALRKSGFTFSLAKLPTGTYSLTLTEQPISDLSILKGAPISELWVGLCNITDLAPIHDLPLRVLGLYNNPQLKDLGPLRGMRLEELSLEYTRVSDLSPLAGLPLKKLYLHGCENLTDVSPLAGISTLEILTVPMNARNIELLRNLKKLKWLDIQLYQKNAHFPASTPEQFWKDFSPSGWVGRLRDSGVNFKTLKKLPDGTWEVNLEYSAMHDLTILSGVPISRLNLSKTAVTDLTPLKGMSLVALNLNMTHVADLSPLRGMPLVELRLLNTREITDLSPLADCKKLQTLTLPDTAEHIEFLRTFPKLERISFRDDPNNGYRPDRDAAEFWKEYDEQGWLTALRESGIKPNSWKRLDDGTWEVNLDNTAIADLTILRGAPISRLSMSHTPVSDLKPLRGMAIKQLWLFDTKVTDLSPLKGMPIETLNLGGTKVSDLSALRGMPLIELSFLNCTKIIDFSPIAGATTLKFVTLPPGARNFDFLRTSAELECIGYKQDSENGYRPDYTAAEFWKEFDANKK